MKCLAKDRNNDSCRNYTIDANGVPTRFCKLHQYMNEYTPEMLSATRLCTGCKKMRYFSSESKTCVACLTRDKSKYKKPTQKCAHPECEFKRSEENEYCGKHQLQVFINATEEIGKRVCYDHIRGCRSQLDQSYPFAKCRDCLDRESAADRERRHKAMLENPSDMTNKICTVCCKEQNLSEFIFTDERLTKTCQTCRLQNKTQNAKRDKDHRNALARKNINRAFYSYQKEAKRRDIAFYLSMDEFVDIVERPCAYCGDMSEEKNFNGVDRVDSKLRYTLDNCVSACTLCNYLKHVMPVDLFFQRIEHILTRNERIRGNLHPEAFPNFISGDYEEYVKSARDRGLEFELSTTEFAEIIRNDCYLCGKSNRFNHRNGVDRFDNTIGYCAENASPCCNTCNMMKNRYSYSDVMEKFERIYKYRIQGKMEADDIVVNPEILRHAGMATLPRDGLSSQVNV